MILPFKIKQHDLQPYYPFSVPEADSLTGATIVCTMVDVLTGTKKIDRQAAGCVITDAASREAEYRWQASDTDTAGKFKIEFEITPPSGGKFTVPSGSEVAYVIISSDLDGV